MKINTLTEQQALEAKHNRKIRYGLRTKWLKQLIASGMTAMQAQEHTRLSVRRLRNQANHRGLGRFAMPINGPKKPVDMAELQRRKGLVAGGMTVVQLSQVIDRSVTATRQYVARHGIQVLKPIRVDGLTLSEQHAKMELLCSEGGHGAVQIARLTGLHRATVYRYALKNCIKLGRMHKVATKKVIDPMIAVVQDLINVKKLTPKEISAYTNIPIDRIRTLAMGR